MARTLFGAHSYSITHVFSSFERTLFCRDSDYHLNIETLCFCLLKKKCTFSKTVFNLIDLRKGLIVFHFACFYGFLSFLFKVQAAAVVPSTSTIRVNIPFTKAHSLPPLKVTNLKPTLGGVSVPICIPSLPDTPVEISASTSPCNSISALIAAPTSADAFRRAHRHSIPGHRLNNYLKFLKELAAKGSSIAYVFSTAVISGVTPDAPDALAAVQGENMGKI